MRFGLEEIVQLFPGIRLSDEVEEFIRGILDDSEFGDVEDLKEAIGPFLLDAGLTQEDIDRGLDRIQGFGSDSLNDGPIKLEERILSNLSLEEPEKRPEPIQPAPKCATNEQKEKSLVEKRPIEIVATSQTSRFHVDTLTTLSNDIDIPGVCISIGETEILVDTRLKLSCGVHYGLVGENGVGKTTLLKSIGWGIIPGLPLNIKVLYVEQIESIDASLLLVDSVVLADVLGMRIRRERRMLEEALESQDANKVGLALLQIEFGRATDELEEAKQLASKRSGARGAEARQRLNEMENRVGLLTQAIQEYQSIQKPESSDKIFADAHAMLGQLWHENVLSEEEATAKATKILIGLGFSVTQAREPLHKLSSGWQVRVALARALFVEPDVLLLDEPQNYLSIDAILWLQKYLNDFSGTIVTISHDRCFLNEVSEEIILLKQKTLNYYQETRTSRQKYSEKMVEKQEKKKAQLEKTIQQSIAYARKSGDDKKLGLAASRKKKLVDRVGLEANAKGHRFKLNRDMVGYFTSKRTDATSLMESEDAPIAFSFPEPEVLRHQGPLVQIESITYKYPNTDKPTLSGVTLNIGPTSRIALIGRNGAGKSTLAQLICGTLEPSTGRINRHAQARIGFYTQSMIDKLSQIGRSVLGHVRELRPEMSEQEIRGHFALYGLGNQAVAQQMMCTLSGGQLVRVAVGIATLSKPHLLVLDEVSAHLSLETVKQLTQAISEYSGAVVLVSHDRWLVREFGGECYLVQDGSLTRMETIDDYVSKCMKGMD